MQRVLVTELSIKVLELSFSVHGSCVSLASSLKKDEQRNLAHAPMAASWVSDERPHVVARWAMSSCQPQDFDPCSHDPS